MNSNVLVIGATGSVGSELVSLLVQRGAKVRAATRQPSKHTTGEVEFTEFDFERPETFAQAISGADRVFLIARPGDDFPQRTAIPLIDEMKRQGVQHVVNLSAMGVETRDDMGLRIVERYLEDSGIGYTHLRPNFFMQVFTSGALLADIRSGAIHLPAADATLSYVDVRDIAEVAAAALTSEDHLGKAYTITGGESLDHYQIADIISSAAKKKVEYIPISEDIAREGLLAAGFSTERVERVIGFYKLVRAAFCSPVSPDIEGISGRPAISFAQFARENASVWA